eukprot:s1463_g1.t1
MAAMVQSIFDNEMRCVTQEPGCGADHKKKGALNGLDVLPALQNGTAAAAGAAEAATTEAAEDTGGSQSDAVVVAADTAGALQPLEVAKKKAAPNALSEEMRDARATVVEEVIPPITIKALVHLFLYAIHQEAIAFRNGASSEVPVRLVSAMINACIAALAAVMTLGNGMNLTGSTNALDLPFDTVEAGGKVSCDYDICEAVSQAMTEGAQLVPRARVAQLQVERGIDALRPEVQEMLQDNKNGVFPHLPGEGY